MRRSMVSMDIAAPAPPPAPGRPSGSTVGQGLTLVHFSAQPEVFLTQNTPYTPPNTHNHPLNTSQTPHEQPPNATPV